jgi:hypothetical protein
LGTLRGGVIEGRGRIIVLVTGGVGFRGIQRDNTFDFFHGVVDFSDNVVDFGLESGIVHIDHVMYLREGPDAMVTAARRSFEKSLSPID